MRTSSTDRYDGIQVLRLVAALLVVVTHATLYTTERLNPGLGVWRFGAIGVDIFFVISGFVMMASTRSLVGMPDGWKYFAMRRITRIVPIYWIATTVKLLTLLAIPAAVLHATLSSKVLMSYFFLPTRNVDGNVEPLLGVGWTLLFEMAFYTIFAISLLVRANTLAFCGIVLSALAVGNIFRGDSWPPALVYLDAQVLYFLAGMMIAAYVIRGHRARYLVGLAYVAGLAAFIHIVNAVRHGTFSVWLDLLRHPGVVALVLAVVVAEPLLSGRVPRVLTFGGDASYSLYLFHPLCAPIVPTALAVLGLTNAAVSVVLCVVAVTVVASFIYRFVERPTTRQLHKRLPYVRTPKPRMEILTSSVRAEADGLDDPHGQVTKPGAGR